MRHAPTSLCQPGFGTRGRRKIADASSPALQLLFSAGRVVRFASDRGRAWKKCWRIDFCPTCLQTRSLYPLGIPLVCIPCILTISRAETPGCSNYPASSSIVVLSVYDTRAVLCCVAAQHPDFTASLPSFAFCFCPPSHPNPTTIPPSLRACVSVRQVIHSLRLSSLYLYTHERAHPGPGQPSQPWLIPESGAWPMA
ncbi:hypothetical protein DFH06DRAFT_609858 [Mycena polygramma]|nr:hypothetical protein DFH06DRAFT_609858 [Mycena polygramma]